MVFEQGTGVMPSVRSDLALVVSGEIEPRAAVSEGLQVVVAG